MVTLDVADETSTLTDLCVCLGTAVPHSTSFASDHPEHRDFPMLPWDTTRLIAQQEAFFDVLQGHGVRLHKVPHSDAHPWQMYTRDTGFVVGDTLFYAPARTLPERVGEIDLIRQTLPGVKMTEIGARIEGGDVLPDGDVVFVGLGTRSTRAGVAELAACVDAEVVPIDLGPSVMHLDCRMTILPGRRLLTYTGDFRSDDLAMLRKRFTLIEVSQADAKAMATNVFVINPETVVMHAGFADIISRVEAAGLHVKALPFSEPNALLGSFRCSTMPLVRTS